MKAFQTEEQKEFESVRKTIKGLLNSLNDSLYQMKQIGYDTETVYDFYDLLRYDLLTDEGIQLLMKSAQLEEIISHLRIADSILLDLNKTLGFRREKLNADIASYENSIERLKSIQKPAPFSYEKSNEIEKAAAVMSIITFLSIGVYGIINKQAEKEDLRPQTITISMDTLGNHSYKETYPYLTPEDSAEVIEFSEADENGLRIKRIYHIPQSEIEILDTESLSSIDLTGYSFEQIEVDDEETNNISTDPYRVYQVTLVDENVQKKYDMGPVLKLTEKALICVIAALVWVILYCMQKAAANHDLVMDPDEFINEMHKHLSDLIKYKKSIQQQFKRIESLGESTKEEEKIVNKICSRIDATIEKALETLKQLEGLERSHPKRENEEYQNYRKLGKLLNQALKKYEETGDSSELEELKQMISISPEFDFDNTGLFLEDLKGEDPIQK